MWYSIFLNKKPSVDYITTGDMMDKRPAIFLFLLFFYCLIVVRVYRYMGKQHILVVWDLMYEKWIRNISSTLILQVQIATTIRGHVLTVFCLFRHSPPHHAKEKRCYIIFLKKKVWIFHEYGTCWNIFVRSMWT